MPFEPEKITREHIDKAVQKIKEENIFLHFSTGYDVIIEGKAYPPKEIMRYAHEQMNGEKVWERSGGEPTNKYFENFGFEIVEKKKNIELYELKQEFLDKWPLERVKSMKLDEYTNLNKEDSFCYWVESKTRPLGSIQGGTSYKFGIYKRENTDTEDSRDAYLTDGEYAWLRKYGKTKEEAFESVKHLIIQVVEAATDDKLEVIDGVDLGDAYKWKIAFLYSKYQVINILSAPNIRWSGEYKGFEEANTAPISEIHRYLIDKKPSDTDFYEYSKSLWAAYNKMEGKRTEISTDEKTKFPMSLNQILFGPPGTGKTFYTVNKALQIIDPDFYEENKNDREALTKRYRELLITDWENHKSGQIAMTTFHQSFTYEDFIEGIKPLLIDQNNENGEESETKSELGYKIQNGIFKNISELARQESGGKVGQAKGRMKWDREQFNKAEFYKLSLGNVNIAEDDEIYKYCINNERIGIGFLWDEDLTNVEESKINQLHIDNPDYDKHDCTSMAIFRHHLKEGYYVVIANGNHKFRAIGKVVGDYFYDKDSPIRYPHFRKVEWIAKDLDLSVDLIYNKNFSQKTIYHLRKKDIKPEFFVRSKATPISSSDKKPFVLIIDEINRGNIAQIFGELITLIEEDKREGMDEEMSVSLPYSKQPFSVPSNLHIIGTMNTADRSIEALDTALRRRFTFEEMPPKPEIIEQDGKTNIVKVAGKDIELTGIIETINKRVEKLLDKDHMIGHSYFMKVSDVTDLRKTFQKNIIPLLEEYFYGDKGKIQMILGKGFIEKSDISNDNVFADSDYEGASLMDEKEVWTMSNAWKDNDEKFNEALQTLLS